MLQRVVLAIMAFLAIVNAYTMRISLSIVITELVTRRNHTKEDIGTTVCEAEDDGLDPDTSVSEDLLNLKL